MDYTGMDIDTQFAHITSELPNVDLLNQKAAMWTKAGTELTSAESNFSTATKNLAPDWQDAVGEQWLDSAQASQRTLGTWAQNVNQNNPSTELTGVSKGITDTHQTVAKFKEVSDALKPLLSMPLIGAMVQAILKQMQQASGAVMNQLSDQYATAGNKVAAAGSGGPWEGLNGSIAGGGNQAATFSPSGQLVSPGSGSADGMLGGSGSAAGQDGGAASQESGVDSGLGSDSPELSGGGGLAPSPVAPSMPAPAPPAMGAPGGMPVSPAFMAPVGRGAGAGRAGGGSVRMPGVSIGRTGPAAIPVAGAPVNALTSPAPTAAAPTPPQLFATPAASANGSGNALPMTPMMGGAGMGFGGGGGTSGIGAGLARRPKRGTDEDEDTPTPGLPVVLSGKAGVADPHAFVTRQRTTETADAPSTVQFIDEDLWQPERPATTPDRASAGS
jgi:hypothetical protein